MEFLGIGPLELVLIILLALVILGPKEMEKMSKTVGKSLNKLIKSDIWKDIQSTSDKVKNLPTELMRNAQMEELEKSLHAPLEEKAGITPRAMDEPKIAPPLQQGDVIVPSPLDDQQIAPTTVQNGRNPPAADVEKTDPK